MSQFASKFDLVTEESFAAPGAVALTLEVASLPSPAINSQGTPQPGTLTAGSIVRMDSAGKAVLASSATIFSEAAGVATLAAPVMPLVVIDGDDTFSGSFVRKVTCLAGGFQMKTAEIVAADVASFTKGAAVSFASGKVAKWEAGKQVLGFVGKDGYDAATATLHVVVVPKF